MADMAPLCCFRPGGMRYECGAGSDIERQGCDFYFPAGPYDAGCMHHRIDLDGRCDNAAAHDAAADRHRMGERDER